MGSGYIWFDEDEISENLLDATLNGRYSNIARWNNRKVGEITDLLGDNNFRFIDYKYIPPKDGHEKDVREIHSTFEDQLKCPVVASGIVGYWLHNRRCENYNVKNLFEAYYNKCLKAYCEQRGKDSDSWNSDPTREFITSVHLQEESKKIDKSKDIFPYLREDDVNQIIPIATQYRLFIRTKAREYILGISVNGKRCHFPLHKSKEYGVQLYDFLKTDGYMNSSLDSWLYFMGFVAEKPFPLKQIVWLTTREQLRVMLVCEFEELINNKTMKASEYEDYEMVPFINKDGEDYLLSNRKCEFSTGIDNLLKFYNKFPSDNTPYKI